jgi:large subunit ribosomal protein L22
MSASKARQVLDLIRGQDVDRAAEILAGTEREAAEMIGKVLNSAVANAAHNDHQNPDELYVSACFADEGTTAKRWRPRARGRATRIRKRSCHITIVVSRLPADRLERRRTRQEAITANRSRRVDASRRRADLSGRRSRRNAAIAQSEADAAAAAELEAEELVEDADVATDVEEIETTVAAAETLDDEGVGEDTEDTENDEVADEVVADEADTADDDVVDEAGTKEKGK